MRLIDLSAKTLCHNCEANWIKAEMRSRFGGFCSERCLEEAQFRLRWAYCPNCHTMISTPLVVAFQGYLNLPLYCSQWCRKYFRHVIAQRGESPAAIVFSDFVRSHPEVNNAIPESTSDRVDSPLSV
jgi:hypothetical protein